MTFYHYTCEEMAEKIGPTGVLVPNSIYGSPPLVWLTDLDVPDIEALGLTAHELDCDRAAVRYRTRRQEFTPWVGSKLHASMPAFSQAEFHRGRSPDRWFVSLVRVAVIRDDPE